MTDAELALQQHLDEELNRLRPRPVPTEAVYGRARAIRHTRRVWAAGALATAAVLGTSVPVLGSMGLGRSAAGGGRAVTVDAPHIDNKGRSVFSGSEGGKRWSVTVAPNGCPSAGNFTPACNGSTTGNNPAAFDYTGSAGSPATYAVFFRSDITRIDVAFSDGEQVTLLPGVVKGHRVSLLVVPPKLRMARVDAYEANGNLAAYSIPFQSDTFAHLAMWYRPGQTPTQPEASGTITGTTPKDEKASVDVHIGPFGICYTVAQLPVPSARSDTSCQPFTTQNSDDVPPRALDWVALGGRVDNRVDHVVFELSAGTVRAPVVHIGGYSFAVCFEAYNFGVLGRTEYDASGHVISHEQTPTKS